MHIFIDLDTNKDMGIIKSDFLDNIREHFSEADPQALLKKHIYKAKSRYIATRKYAITEAGRFQFGLLPDIVKYLKNLNTPFRIIFSEQFKERYASSYSFYDEPLKDLKFKLRDYQEEGVKSALKNGNGLLIEPTGAGKTLMQASLIYNIMNHKPDSKVLLITMTHLINQLYDEFVNYGINPEIISKWSGDNELNISSNIIICGTNILYSKIDNIPLEIKKVKIVFLTLKKQLNDINLSDLDKEILQSKMIQAGNELKKLEEKLENNKRIHKFLENIDLLICDEVHQWKKSGEIINVLKYITTRNRYGFTGTLPEMMIDQWNIIGHFGPIIHESKRQELVEAKHITDADVRVFVLEYKNPPDLNKNDLDEEEDEEKGINSFYEAELDFIHHSQFRNKIIRKIVNNLSKNSLILIDRLEHGDLLYEFLKTTLENKQVFYIKGEVEDEERQKIQQLMEKEDNIVCIAVSKIFSTGVNIKNLHYIIFTSAGKAKIKNIQSIGRGVRPLQGKDKVVIFDISDMLHYSQKHLEQRIKIYDNDSIKYQIIKIKET